MTTRNSRRRRQAATAIALVGAAGAAAAYARYRRDIAEARARIAHGSRIAATRCGPIEYAAVGEGSPVLVVHGAGGGYDQALDFAEPLVRAGHRVVLVSRFGYLRTPLPVDASAAAQADAHAHLLDALGLPDAAVVGVSAGAPSSLQLALRHPARCRRLVLLVPALYVPRPGAGPAVTTPTATRVLFETALRSDFAFWAAMRVARPLVLRALLATPPEVVARATPDEQARVERVMRHILPVAPRRLGLINDAAVTSSLPRYDLERVAVPTLAISVADDLFGTFDAARYTAEHIPGARFVGVPDGGHLWVGHHRQLMDEIAAFLR